MSKVVQQNGAWIYQVGSPKLNGPDSTTGAQTPPQPAPPITDATPPPTPLSGPMLVLCGAISNPVIPALEVSLTNLNGVNFQSTCSDTKTSLPLSAQGTNVIQPVPSISFRNPA